MTAAVIGVPPARNAVVTTKRRIVITAVAVGNAAKADGVTPASATTITTVKDATRALGGAARTQTIVTTSHPRAAATDPRAVPPTMSLLTKMVPRP